MRPSSCNRVSRLRTYAPQKSVASSPSVRRSTSYDASARGELSRATRKGRACGQAAVQDRYVGDVGDFGKYGLLRMLRDDRSVKVVRERGVLPEGTVFYERLLSFAGTPGIGRAATERRLERRRAWARDAPESTRGRDVILAVPDNGLEPRAGSPALG